MLNLKKCLIPFEFSINILIISLIRFKTISSECLESSPILKNNDCTITYCTESEFTDNTCSVNNTKIKTQWLTNIIIFGDYNARFVSFANFSNGDFVVLATPCKLLKPIRFFFGLKKNGRDLFKVNNKESSLYSYELETNEEDNSGKKYQGEIQVATMNQENNKEYLLSLSKATSYAELYDLENGVMYKKKMSEIFGIENQNDRQISLAIKSSDNKYYSIYGFVDNSNIYIFKFSLDTKNSIESLSSLSSKSKDEAKGDNASCFETNINKRIVCFFYSNKGNPAVYILDHNLEQIGYNHLYYYNYYEKENFIKCIHFKDEIGVFAFYDYVDENDNNIYPKIFFIEIANDGLLSNPIPIIADLCTILSYANFNKSSLMNDIAKISDTKVCYTASLEGRETFFIVVYHIINMEKIKIRYYSFPIFQLRNFKILSDMKSFSYNQFVVIAASVCNQSVCNNDHYDDHYSSVIIFSYPNSTDIDFDISDELLKEKEKTIEDLEIDLKNYVRIENNIFGYIYKKIQMNNIICNNNYIKLYSTKNNLPISGDYNLDIDEKIKLKFEDNNYLADNCSFEYSLIIIEPDKDEYDDYTKHIDLYFEDETESEFNSMKTPLIGRTSYFNISLKNNLIKSCSHINCDLCLEISPSTCIICKSDSYFDFIDGTAIKICNQSFSELQTTIIETTLPKIETTLPKIETTLPIIKTTQPKIKTTQPKIETTLPKIETTLPKIKTTLPKIKTTLPKIETTLPKIDDNCSPEGIINNLCKNKNITENESEEIYQQLKKDNLNLESAKQNKIVETNNIIYQVATLEVQKNSKNPSVSSIDLGDCEGKLREKYEMTDEDEFIIIKKDIKDGLTTYVEYEIYNSKNLVLLSLDICNDTQISIDIPVNLKEETQSLYDKMSQLGYNLFDSNDSFYNDICATYTSESGTDILLSDRKEDIFKNNGDLTLCQSGCQLESYDVETKKAKCTCKVQETKEIDAKNTDTSKKFDKQEFADNFFATLKNSNIMVVKCYKLVLTLDNLFKNIGRLIMTGILVVSLILIIICIIFERNKINVFIKNIMRNKLYNSKNNKKEIKRNNSKNNIKNKVRNPKKRSKSFSKHSKKKSSESGPPKKLKDERKPQKAKTEKKSNKKNLYKSKPKNEKKSLKNDLKKSQKKVKKQRSSSFKKINNKSDVNHLVSSSRKPTINININNINIKRSLKKKKSQEPLISVYQPKDKILYEIKKYNSRELNSLNYKEALIYDKRTYFQYYGSLILQKHLIIFSFYPYDYNLYTIKIVLFLLSFSLYFSINGLFFSDETMHKIYEDKGAFNILYQIPQIIYSSVISALINTILKQLSLSEKNILALKQEEKYEIAKKKSKTIRNCLIIKFSIFFVIIILFIIFFWYFISCFCAVFSNTQIILIKDTFMSFGLSMVYPFGLNLLPGFFRIPALRDKNRECLYKISSIIALI